MLRNLRVPFLFAGCLFISEIAAGQNCGVNAGLPQTVCAANTLVLTGSSGGPFLGGANYTWTKVTGPGCVIATPNQAVTNVVNLTPGSYLFKLSSTCSDGKTASQTVAITVNNDVTIPDAGPDVNPCSTGTITLAGNAPAAGETGAWSNLSGGGTLANASSPAATFTSTTTGIKQLVWTITNGTCTRRDTMADRVLGATFPVTGTNKVIACTGTTTTLVGSNPGLPPQSGLWTLVSGPNVPTILNPTATISALTNLVAGTYFFHWTVSGPCVNGTANVTIQVNNNYSAPLLGANVASPLYCNNQNITSVMLTGKPTGTGETAAWTQTVGPTAGVSIASPTNYITNITGLDGASNYIFKYTVTNTAGCSSSLYDTLVFTPSVTGLSTPPDKYLNCGDTSTTVSFAYSYANTLTNGFTRGYTVLSYPAGNPVAPTAALNAGSTGSDTWTLNNMSKPGKYVFRFEYRNACDAQYRTVSIFVSMPPPAANAGSNQVLPCNATSATLVGNVPATAFKGKWTQVSGPTAAAFANDTLALSGVSNLATGTYTFRWLITGGNNCPPALSDMTMTVSSAAVTAADAGIDRSVCNSFPLQLSGNQPGLTQTGTWSVSPATGVTFSSANAANAMVYGLSPSTVYSFVWKIANSCDSSRDTVLITTNSAPTQTVAAAGPDQCVAGGTSVITLSGNAPGAASPSWTALDGGTVGSPSGQATAVSLPANGTYRFVYTLSIAGCGSAADTVVVTASPAVTTAAAGPDQVICSASLPVIVSLAGNIPSVGTAAWRLASGNADASIASPSAASTAVSNLSQGVYVFQYSISNGVCPSSRDSIQVTVGQLPSTAVAGTNISQCGVSGAISLAANTPAVGTGFWSTVTGPPGTTPVFSNAASPTSAISNLSNGAYVLRWTVSNTAECPASTSDMNLTVKVAASAAATTAGLCNTGVASLVGNPNTSGTWSVTSANTLPVITANGPNTATATGLSTGTYSFVYTIPAGGGCPASASPAKVVTVSPAPTAANAGADIFLCPGSTSVTLTGNTPSVGTPTWYYTSGPALPMGGTANTVASTFTALQAGVYFFTYTVASGNCPVSGDVAQVVVERAAAAGPSQALCGASSTMLSATAPAYYSASWVQASGPSTAVFANASSPATSVTGLVPGAYQFKWSIQSPAACGVNAATDTVVVDTPAAAANAGADVAVCESGSAVTIGTPASGTGVTYSWSPAAYLSDSTLAQPLFTPILPGTYNYALTTTRGGCSSTDHMVMTVNPTPPTPVTDAPAGVCGPGTVQAVHITNADPAVTYTWDNSLGTGTPKTIGAGSYIITTARSGCVGNTLSFSVTTKAKPLSSFTATGASVINVSALSAGTGASYIWDFGANATPATATSTATTYNNVAYSILANKTIRLVVAAANGCTDTSAQTFLESAPLPVTLYAFDAVWQTDHSLLNWTFLNDPALSRIDVERSMDGSVFHSIAVLPFTGGNKQRFDMGYRDTGLPAGGGKIFYRLRFTEYAGPTGYSPVREVNRKEAAILTAAPNPFRKELSVDLHGSAADFTAAGLYDVRGSLVKAIGSEALSADHLLRISGMDALPAGTYFLKVTTGEVIRTVKVIKD